MEAFSPDGSIRSLERVEFVDPLLFLFFAAGLVALTTFRCRRLFLLAIRRSSACIGARLNLRSMLHIIGLCRGLRRFLYGRKRLIVGWTNDLQSSRILCSRNPCCVRCRCCALWRYLWAHQDTGCRRCGGRSRGGRFRGGGTRGRRGGGWCLTRLHYAGSNLGATAGRCATAIVCCGHILQRQSRTAISRSRCSLSVGNRGCRLRDRNGRERLVGERRSKQCSVLLMNIRRSHLRNIGHRRLPNTGSVHRNRTALHQQKRTILESDSCTA